MATRTTVEQLWEHHGFLRDLCQSIVGDFATADDIVQETYLKALDHLDTLDLENGRVKHWLATVARRRSIDELRRRRRRAVPLAVVGDEPAGPREDPALRCAASETVRALSEALTSLTPREQALLTRRVTQGIPLADLALEEETTVASVRSVLARARTKLRAAIDDDPGSWSRATSVPHRRPSRRALSAS